MVVKMHIAQELFLKHLGSLKKEISIDSKDTEKLNNFFIFDAEKILGDARLTDTQKQCLDYRISEHREIVKTAYLLREISGRLGIKALKEAAGSIKKDFALRLQKVTAESIDRRKKKKLSFRYMLGDHFITIEKTHSACRLVFLNCPIYGVFHYLGFMAEGEIFCQLCEAHGEIMTKSNIPIRHKFSLSHSLCAGSKRCEFSMNVINPAVNLLLKCVPDKTINFLLGLSEPKHIKNEF